jgi:hypothetical protein
MVRTSARAWLQMPPGEAASLLARDADGDWARQFLRQFEREIQHDQLEHVMDSWAVSAAAMSRIFGVSRQAVAKWRTQGVPADRSVAMADLAAANDVLERYVRPDRIPAVVRRRSDMLGGVSLLELAQTGDTAAVRRQVAAMFDLRRVAP